MPCGPEIPGYTRSRFNHPTASGGQEASLNRAKDTSAASTPSTEGDRQEGGELRPTRDRMPARERDYRSRAGDAPLTSLFSLRVAHRECDIPGRLLLRLQGTRVRSTGRQRLAPPRERRIGRTPGGVGSVPAPDPRPPQAQRGHEQIQGQTLGGQLPAAKFRGTISGENPGAEPPGGNLPGAGANFRGPGPTSGGTSGGRAAAFVA